MGSSYLIFQHLEDIDMFQKSFCNNGFEDYQNILCFEITINYDIFYQKYEGGTILNTIISK